MTSLEKIERAPPSAAVVPGRHLTAIAVGPGGSAWTSDGGGNWQAIDGLDYWSVGFAPDGVGWMVGPDGRIVRITFEEKH